MKLLLLALFACSKTESDVETDAVDSETDVIVETDTDGDSDTDVDTDITDTGFTPDPDCTDYGPWIDVVTFCNGQPTRIWEYRSLYTPYDEESCPPYYVGDDQAYETLDAAMTSLECNKECVYSAHIAAMFVYCEYRGEYTSYAAGNETCPELIWVDSCMGSGWATSWEDYQAENECDDSVCVPRDTDADGLYDRDEALYGTDPNVADTDGGGENDGSEVDNGRDPLDPSDDAI